MCLLSTKAYAVASQLFPGEMFSEIIICHQLVYLGLHLMTQITGESNISTVCLSHHQRKYQIKRYWPFMRGIHRWPMVPLTKSQQRRKRFHVTTSSCNNSGPPLIRFRPPSDNWRPPFNNWWALVIIWRPPFINWMPPHNNWRPRVINWRPPLNWWPKVIN